jgi:hypothetical protein
VAALFGVAGAGLIAVSVLRHGFAGRDGWVLAFDVGVGALALAYAAEVFLSRRRKPGP